MRLDLRWTLAAVAVLGGTAIADSGQPAAVSWADTALVEGSHRGVAQDYLVMPSGAELGAQMRFITSDAVLSDQPLRFTDLALFELSGRVSVTRTVELSGQVALLPKQPASMSEAPWQSAGLGVRDGLSRHVALALSAAAGHLIAHDGLWTRGSLAVEAKKTIDPELLAFDVQGGVDGIDLHAPGTPGATLGELSVQTSALFREPTGHWGAWLGLAYAVPIYKRGVDPTTGMALDPQPRLDFHIGTVLSLVPQWDLYADFAVIDRGDAASPATRLPILDGGFDQRQLVLGVTRHFAAPCHGHAPDDGDALEQPR